MDNSIVTLQRMRGKTPKALVTMSAERFADGLIRKCLPLIELFFSENQFFDNYYFSNKLRIINYLRYLKHWYWRMISDFHTSKGTKYRWQVNQAFREELDFHCQVMGGPRDLQLFCIFMFQMLFQYEAGFVTTGQVYVIDPFCKNLEFFADEMRNFYITAFSSDLLFFKNLRLAVPLLRKSPYIEFLKLRRCDDKFTMITIRSYLKKLTSVHLGVDTNISDDKMENLLCEFFFNNERNKLLSIIQREEEVEVSFPFLKSVSLYSDKGHDGPPLLCIKFLLQYFYTNLSYSWENSVGSKDRIIRLLRQGLWCPPFIIGKNFSWDKFVFYNGDKANGNSHESEGLVPYCIRAKYIEIFDDVSMISEFPGFIRKILLRFGCQNLCFNYSSESSGRLYSLLGMNGPFLQELYLTGPLLCSIDGAELSGVLSVCVNLTTLALKLDLVCSPRYFELGCLRNIKVLSFKVKHYPEWSKFPIEEKLDKVSSEPLPQRVDEYINNVRYEFGLPAYIQKHGHKEYSYLPGLGVAHSFGDRNTKNNQLSRNIFENLGYCNDDSRCGTCKTCATIDTFGSVGLKYDIPHKNTTTFGFGVLECHRLIKTSKPLVTFRKRIFSFFGNKEFKYSSHDDDDHRHVKGYGPPSDKLSIHGTPGDKISIYGSPNDRLFIYGTPSDWLSLYGTPSDRLSLYGTPSDRLSIYGTPSDRLSVYGTPSDRLSINGTPSDRLSIYGSRSDRLPIYGTHGSYNYDNHCSLYFHGDIEDSTLKSVLCNRVHEEKENVLRQWRPDMDFSAPKTILRALIFASLNLQCLEIPDLRTIDICSIFYDRAIVKNLQNLETLHLSCQFSKQLSRAISILPSLQTVKVDPCYGIDNFLRFKREFYQTNLKVMCCRSFFYSEPKYFKESDTIENHMDDLY